MPEIKRRELIVAAGAAAAAGGAATAIASDGSGAHRRPLHLDTSRGTPVLPKAHDKFSFPLATAKPTVTTPGGSVTELTEDNFPVFKGNAAAIFYLVLKPGRLREPHWHPNAWELDFCVEGKGELGIITPDGDTSTSTLSPGDIGFVPQAWGHYIRNVGPGDMKFAIAFNNSVPNDVGLSTMFGGMPTNTFSQTLGVPQAELDRGRRSPKTLLIVQRRG